MEHGVAVLERRAQGGSVKKIGRDRLRSELAQQGGIRGRAAEAADGVAGGDETPDDGAPQDAGGPGNENLHALIPFFTSAGLHGLFTAIRMLASDERSARSAAEALLKPYERFFDGAWIRPPGEAAHEIGDGLRAERLAPGHLGAQHGGVDGAGQAIDGWIEGGGAALANLGAAESGVSAFDGVHDGQ